MTRQVLLFGRVLVFCALVGWFVAACGRAADVELASGVLSEEAVAPVRLKGRTHVGWPVLAASSESAPPSKRIASADVTQGKGAAWWARRAIQNGRTMRVRGRTIRRLRRELASREIGPTLAIRLVFGPYADAALRVAWCESRWHTGATNGQYLGLFQMGDYARGRYGHSSSALGQARAAYAYFVASGRDWSPWECRA